MSVNIRENGQLVKSAGKIPGSFATYNQEHFELKGENKEMNLSDTVTTKLQTIDKLNNMALFGMVEPGHWYDGGAINNKYFRCRKDYAVSGKVTVINNTSKDLLFIPADTLAGASAYRVYANTTDEHVFEKPYVWYLNVNSASDLTDNDIKGYLNDLQIYAEIGAVDNAITEELQKGDVYSTNETPIGTWIDGRTIYRKVIREFTLGNGSISTPASVSLPHGASVSTFIRVYGMAYNASNPATVRPLPFAGASTSPTTKSNEIRIDASASSIVITVYENWSAYKAFAVIEYVK